MSLEEKALYAKFGHVSIDKGNSKVKHGKVTKISKETNCGYAIVHFENGNEFVFKNQLQAIVENYIKTINERCDCTHTQACAICAKEKGIDWKIINDR